MLGPGRPVWSTKCSIASSLDRGAAVEHERVLPVLRISVAAGVNEGFELPVRHLEAADVEVLECVRGAVDGHFQARHPDHVFRDLSLRVECDEREGGQRVRTHTQRRQVRGLISLGLDHE